MADDKVIRAILRYETDKASLAQTERGLTLLQRNLERLRDQGGSGWARLKAATQDNAKAVDALRQAYIKAADAAGDLVKQNKGLSLGGAANILSKGGKALSVLGYDQVGDVASGGGKVLELLMAAKDHLTTLAPATGAAATGIGAMTAAIAPLLPILAPVAVGIGAVTVGLNLLDSATAVATSGLGRLLRTIDKINEITGGTEEQAFKGIEENQKEIVKKQDKLKELQAAVDDTFIKRQKESGDFLARLGLSRDKDYNDALAQIESLKKEITDLQSTSNEAFAKVQQGATKTADAEKKEADEKKRLADETLRAYNASKMFNDIFSENMEARRKEAAERQSKEQSFRDQQINEAVAATKKYNEAVKAATEQERQQEIEIQKQYADKVKDIIKKALDDNAAAYKRLTDTQNKLNLDASREEDKVRRQNEFEDLKERIKVNRQERDDLIAHQQKLRDIERSFQSDERDAMLDRNFLQLFKLQESKKEQTDAENESYQQQRRDRAQAFEDSRQDMAMQRQFEANERRVALQQQLTDAQTAYQADLLLNRQAKEQALRLAVQQRDSELMLVQQKRNNILAILLSQYSEEIKLANMSASERLRLLQNEIEQARRMGFNVRQPQPISNTSPYTERDSRGGIIKRFAGGGAASAFSPFMYNDASPYQKESFGGVALPNGMGLAFPFKSGYVDSGGGGGVTIQQSITVQEARNPEATAQAIVRISQEQAIKVIQSVQGK